MDQWKAYLIGLRFILIKDAKRSKENLTKPKGISSFQQKDIDQLKMKCSDKKEKFSKRNPLCAGVCYRCKRKH